MPTTIGLLPTQQESFEHHEELSKLLNETDVFYVPLQNQFTHNQDLSDLTKHFDEDILNKHLVVTFRDIGYSLFLDCVQCIPDQNDQTKTRISGKMIVDGICVQFLGCFDYNSKTREHSETQQINGVGRVLLDEDYYRELSIAQTLTEDRNPDLPESIELFVHTEKPKAKPKQRSRTISENILPKQSSNMSFKSPPSSLSNSRSHLHSPSQVPYTTRSPRTMGHVVKHQYPTSSPINIEVSSLPRNYGVHSSLVSPPSSVSNSFNENLLDLSSPQQMVAIGNLPHLSSSLHHPTTMPIGIPSAASAKVGIPPASLPQLAGLLPSTHSHSLPNYFYPPTNFAYVITNSNQHLAQPFQIFGPYNHPSISYSNAYYAPMAHIQANPFNETLSSLQSKRNDSDVYKQAQPMDTSKQSEEQLPFKKRRYAGKLSAASVHSPMDTNHDDDDASNESMKK